MVKKQIVKATTKTKGENMTYDWKISAKKFGINALYVILAGLASVYGDNQLYLAIAPLLVAIENAIKHWND